MIEQAFIGGLTALLSSMLTWALAYTWFKLRLQNQLDAQIKSIEDEFERRVKAGVLAAGRELLPDFRNEVRVGFKEALAQSPLSMVEGAARTVGKGADLFGDSLNTLFGLRPKK
jgi:hypothetical protein